MQIRTTRRFLSIRRTALTICSVALVLVLIGGGGGEPWVKTAQRYLEETVEGWQPQEPALFNFTKPDDAFFQTTVHVLQFGDVQYAEKMEKHTNYNVQWAKQANYDYHVELTKKEGDRCVFTVKVGEISKFLHEMPLNDWVLFVDMDAHYSIHNDPFAFDRFVSNAQTRAHNVTGADLSLSCEFIAMSAPHTINTGVTLFQATEWTRNLVDSWLDLQERKGFCYSAADQITLQNVLLEHMYAKNEMFKAEGPEGGCGMRVGDEDMCAANLCYEDEMEKSGFPHGERYMDRACMVGCHAGLQCHGDCNHKQTGCGEAVPIFHHNKNPLSRLRAAEKEE